MNNIEWIFKRPIAHRGLHDASRGVVENSLSAARAAITHNYGIECDVQLTTDGEVVVFHDFALERLTGIQGHVFAYNVKDLCSLDLLNTTDKIPTLEEFINQIAGRVPLIIEIKSRFDGNLCLTQRVAEIVSKIPQNIAIKSFDPACIEELKHIAPHIPRGIVGMKSYECDEFAHLDDCHKFGLSNLLLLNEALPNFISWNIEDLAGLKSIMEKLDLKIPVLAWTIRTELKKQMAMRYANQIIFEGFLP